MKLKKLNAVSLFSGAGGMDVGFKNAGFEIIYANELNKHACATYRENLGDHIHEGDVYNELKKMSSFRGVDCVFGGPPCQGFSVAGKMDLNDERSHLVKVFMSAVEIIRPKMFIMENVKGLANLSKFSQVRLELFEIARKLGYSVDLALLNSKEFGVPQARERMFFVGLLDRSQFKLTDYTKQHTKPEISTREAIKHLGRQGTDTNPQTCKAEVTLAANPVMRRSPYAGMIFNGLGRPLNPEKPCATLPASMGGNKTPVIDEEQFYGSGDSWVEKYHAELMQGQPARDWKSTPKFIRRLTLNEAHILHTFPAGYVFKGPNSSIYSQIGNAVPCKLAEVVASSTISAYFDSERVAVSNNQLELELSEI
jgi:DNA (cytosine-5)-methyltransferase 1